MHRRYFLTALGGVGLSACGLDPKFRPGERLVLERDYSLESMTFSTLEGITVSEEEIFYPGGDVVWRGDPPGDRLLQIQAMFEEAASRNIAALNGSVPIDIDVVLVRFHGVSNRTLYTIGGVYHIVFDLTIRAAGTDVALEPTRRVAGQLDAPGGELAARNEAAGQTQKVRVTDYLTGFLNTQLI